MAKTYSVTITDTQDKALSTVTKTNQDWIDNAVNARATAAINDIVAINMAKCNEDGIAIATGVDAQVTQAFDKGYVKANS